MVARKDPRSNPVTGVLEVRRNSPVQSHTPQFLALKVGTSVLFINRPVENHLLYTKVTKVPCFTNVRRLFDLPPKYNCSRGWLYREEPFKEDSGVDTFLLDLEPSPTTKGRKE